MKTIRIIVTSKRIIPSVRLIYRVSRSCYTTLRIVKQFAKDQFAACATRSRPGRREWEPPDLPGSPACGKVFPEPRMFGQMTRLSAGIKEEAKARFIGLRIRIVLGQKALNASHYSE